MTNRAVRGFSLVELMVVIAIIGVMAGIVAPNLLDAIPGTRVNGAARQVLSDLRLARTTAIQKGKRVVVKFDASAGTYDIAFHANAGLPTNYVPSDDELIKHVSLANDFPGIDFRTNAGGATSTIALNANDAVAFQTNGSAIDADGWIYLMPHGDVATNRQDRNRRVTVVASTGNLAIQTYDGTTSTWQ